MSLQKGQRAHQFIDNGVYFLRLQVAIHQLDGVGYLKHCLFRLNIIFLNNGF